MSDGADRTVLAYEAKTPQAKSIDDLIGKIDSAKHQWDTYGAALTLAFKNAYIEHERALKLTESRFKSESAELMWFLLSAFAAGAGGGVAGMLIAPVVAGVGRYAARQMIRRANEKMDIMRVAYKKPNFVTPEARRKTLEAVEKVQKQNDRLRKAGKAGETMTVEGAKEVGVKSVEKAELEKWLNGPPGEPEGGANAFKPPSTDPHRFDLVKRIEIGVCASLLKENVRRFQIMVDKYDFGWETVNKFREETTKEDFIQKQPDANQMIKAQSTEAQNEAELAMWIAWAAARNIEYWTVRLEDVKYIDRGRDMVFYYELRKYDPIVDRLKYLGYHREATMPFGMDRSWNHLARDTSPVLNIPALKQLGNRLPSRFLKKVDNLVEKGRLDLKDIEFIGKG